MSLDMKGKQKLLMGEKKATVRPNDTLRNTVGTGARSWCFNTPKVKRWTTQLVPRE